MTEAASFFTVFGSLFMVGLLGSGHCVGMCGGITAALGFAGEGQRQNLSLVLSYNLGRISSYAIAGALVGLFGYVGQNYLSLGVVLRVIAGVLLILMGLYVINGSKVLRMLEVAGNHLWRRIQPLGQRFLPVTSPQQGFVVGMLWGWLPCGLVYTALAYSATMATPIEGALAMLAFGSGTLPAMVVGGYFSQKLKKILQKRLLRSLMGLLLILFGVWTLWIAVVPHHGAHGANGAVDQVGEHHHHMEQAEH